MKWSLRFYTLSPLLKLQKQDRMREKIYKNAVLSYTEDYLRKINYEIKPGPQIDIKRSSKTLS